MARNYRRLALHRRVLVNLTTGAAIEGVLFDERGALLVLKDAHLHDATGGSAPLDGDAVVDRAQISFVQVT